MLFDGNVAMESLDELLDDEEEEDSALRCDRRQSANQDKQCTLSHFGPRQVCCVHFEFELLSSESNV